MYDVSWDSVIVSSKGCPLNAFPTAVWTFSFNSCADWEATGTSLSLFLNLGMLGKLQASEVTINTAIIERILNFLEFINILPPKRFLTQWRILS